MDVETPPDLAMDTDPNALHAVSPPDASWSSINLAEAVPGVMTPLCSSVWVPASELGLRAPFHAMGVLASKDSVIPDEPAERITGAFFGRMAVRVDFLCAMGDLIPGQTGEALSRDFFGFVPPDFVSRPSNRRLLNIALRYPRTLVTIARKMERLRRETDAWWRETLGRIPSLTYQDTQSVLKAAVTRFDETLAAQAVVSACAISPLHEQLNTLAKAAEVDPTELLRGHGSHEEAQVLADLWALSRDRITMSAFLSRHGYHCAGEGEVASVTWREDPAPVARLLGQYRATDDSDAPNADSAAHVHAGAIAKAKLYRSVGRTGHIKAAVVLRLARRFLPLRGVGKVSYLQSLDVIRACARHLGKQLVTEGRLTDREDIFYLTATELTERLPADLKRVVAERRVDRIKYQKLDLPPSWTGRPQPVTRDLADSELTHLEGVGASPGVITGRAVVVDDPSTADVSEGDILIARTTDPSWVSLMFLSSALVVDIGGMLSHAAVIARELDIPCVMNTTAGTSALRTGDLICVDGAAGTVEIVERLGVAQA